ncbi:MAG: ABC transporter ATP-binding protein [Methanosarcinales archaeon]|nr:ABC transporter ATP-binding protein [Methanosarcinales archaeon]
MIMLTISGVSRFFESETGTVEALRDINLDVFDKEFMCFIGPSGCGKTTLLRIIAGLDQPTSGEVLLDGKVIKSPDPERGMVFQEYSLFPWRTIIDNVAFGLEIKGVPKKERYEIARKYLKMVGLEAFEQSYSYELSGGMRQRVAIVRALANDPKVLLMDEPFGSVDAQTRNLLQGELLRIWGEERKTVLFITHSIDEAVYLADRVVVLSARPGQIREILEIDLERPRQRTSVDVNVIRERLLGLLGEERTRGCGETVCWTGLDVGSD